MGYDRGYVSDERHNRPRRREPSYDHDYGYEERPRRDRRRDDRYDGLFEGRDRRDHRERSRDRDYDRRYRDEGRYRDSRGGRAKDGKTDWQKRGMEMFTAYALPVIKREGVKYLQKQLAGGGSKRR